MMIQIFSSVFSGTYVSAAAWCLVKEKQSGGGSYLVQPAPLKQGGAERDVETRRRRIQDLLEGWEWQPIILANLSWKLHENYNN